MKENCREPPNILQDIMKVDTQKVPKSPASVPSSKSILQKSKSLQIHKMSSGSWQRKLLAHI